MKTRLLFTLMITICTLNLSAQIINVPADFSTIQEGINASSDGDTVLVADGTFKEQISFKGKAITLASHFIIDGDTLHIYNTVIDGNLGLPGDTASTVRFVSGEDTTSVLYGFTIQGGKGILTPYYFGETRLGGGIACIGSTATIKHNRIVNNSTTHEFYALGGGIGCYTEENSKWLVVEENYVAFNECHAIGESGWRSAGGAGMYIFANINVKNNIVQYNECHSTNQSDGAGLEFESTGDPHIFTINCEGNDIQYNLANGVARGIGGGIVNFYGNIYLNNNVISNNAVNGNSTLTGAGVFMAGLENASEIAHIENNVFAGNTIKGTGWSAGSAFCIWSTGFDVTFKNNIVSGNKILSDNGSFSALSMYNTNPLGTLPQSRVEIESNIFRNNESIIGGGLHMSNVLNLFIFNNVFKNNESSYGGGIAIQTSSGIEETHVPVIANNTFSNNNASAAGGAISSALRSSLITFNNLFWENESPDGKALQSFFDSTWVVANSLIKEEDISGKWEGGNNFYDDPQFQDDAFHISMGSPCVNSGRESYVFKEIEYHCPVEDFDGEGRPMYEGVDVGADEMFVVGYSVPESPELTSNLNVFPNPVRNAATIAIELETKRRCTLKVYNSNGIELETIMEGELERGRYEYNWNAASLPNGVYLVRLISDQTITTAKILRLN